ncbi:MAG: type II secretion system protein [Candidatus Gastranaerophilales bacterium]
MTIINKFMKKYLAFTLAEVLITLGVIGVVASLTMPSLIISVRTKALESKKTLFEIRFEDALNQMRTNEKLDGYDNTTEFVDVLSTYMKLAARCEANDLISCFHETIKMGDDLIDVSTLTTGDLITSNSDTSNFNTDNVGVIFAEGTNAIISYDKTCEWLDPYDVYGNREAALACVSIIYDLDAFKGDSIVGKDVQFMNAELPGCFTELSNGTCLTATAFQAGYLTNIECEAQKSSLGISSCPVDLDYWAGAVAYCGGVDKMLSRADLLAIAEETYSTTDISSTGLTDGLTVVDIDYLTNLGLPNPNTFYYYVWTGEEGSDINAFKRGFTSYSTYLQEVSRRGSAMWVICVD